MPAKRGQVTIDPDGTIYISATSFQSATRCLAMFYYQKMLRLVPSSGVQSAALAFGTAVHAAIEDYFRTGKEVRFFDYWNKYASVEMFYTELEQDYVTLLNRGQGVVQGMIDMCRSIKVGRPYTYKNPDGTKALTVEVPSNVQLSKKVVLSRTIDLIAPVGGIPTVIDFKTASQSYYGNQEVISDQLTAYMFPHKLKGVPPAEQAMFIVGTKGPNPSFQSLPAYRSESRLRQLKSDLLALAKIIETKAYFRSRDSRTCKYCAYTPSCYEGVPLKDYCIEAPEEIMLSLED